MKTKPNQSSDGSRRKILKSIAAGSGALIAGKSLPDSWVRPAVDSVILPAHAQTSTCSDLIRLGEVNQCSSITIIPETIHYVDDTSGCPTLRLCPDPCTIPQAQIISVEVGSTPPTFPIWIDVIIGTQPEVSLSQNCGDPQISATDPYTLAFQAVSGAPWTATFSLSRTDVQVSLSDIVLTPV